MIDAIDARENIYKLSVDLEHLAYKFSLLEEEFAKINAIVQELNEEK